jgi:hypothetical protein
MLLRMVLMLIALAFGGSGQIIADGLNPNSAIYLQVKALDDRIFQAYNTCDLVTLAGVVDDNLELYRDKTGLSLGKSSFITAIKNNICRIASARRLSIEPGHAHALLRRGDFKS